MGMKMPFGEIMVSWWIWAYRCHLKVIVDRDQTKSKLDFNWGKNQNKPQVDLKLNPTEILNNL